MDKFVRVQDGRIVSHHRHIPTHHENMSHFNLAQAHIHRQFGFYEVVETGSKYPGRFQHVHITEAYVPEIDAVVREHHLIPMSQDEQERIVAEGWAALRVIRNRKLAETDWTQLMDSPLQPEARGGFADYRTCLRNMTETLNSPFDVAWPDVPST